MKVALKEILLGIIVTVLGGLLVYFIQKDLDDKPKAVETSHVEIVPKQETEISKMSKLTFSSSIEYIKEQFGAPHKYSKSSDGHFYQYDFDSFAFNIGTDSNNEIKVFTIILRDLNQTIPVFQKGGNPNVVLGLTTFSDLKDNNPKILVSVGARTFQYYNDYYFGNPGGYLYYRIGINGNDYPDSSSIPWEHADTIDNTFIGEYKVNFVTAAREKEDLVIGGVY